MKNNLIPTNAKPVDENHLALGEVTGHGHRLQGAIGQDFQIYTKDGVRFCQLNSNVELKHEEHNTQLLQKDMFPKGMEIQVVREYDHFAEEARDVLD